MKLVLIRHADPDYEHDCLTEKGEKEAGYLSEYLKDKKIDEIYVSPLGRAKRTAIPTVEKLGIKMQEEEWLREFEAPICRPDKPEGVLSIPWDWLPYDWTGYPDFYDYDRWMNHPLMKKGGVGKEYERVTGCFEKFLSEHGYEKSGNLFLAKHPSNDTIVFFTHYGVSVVLISYLLHVSPMILWHGLVALPSSITIIATEERRKGYASFRVNTYGETAHLYMNNEPRSFSARFCECFDNEEERH
ncbi:MAG: histidine phosphatase family protein [Lachnospiraceae bacterium]|nr:histidine phosphatase family protein [Lachnospiraceae bacterium]